MCNHQRLYYFHENAPAYCPDCDNYLDSKFLLKEQTIKQRKQKINKILTK